MATQKKTNKKNNETTAFVLDNNDSVSIHEQLEQQLALNQTAFTQRINSMSQQSLNSQLTSLINEFDKSVKSGGSEWKRIVSTIGKLAVIQRSAQLLIQLDVVGKLMNLLIEKKGSSDDVVHIMNTLVNCAMYPSSKFNANKNLLLDLLYGSDEKASILALLCINNAFRNTAIDEIVRNDKFSLVKFTNLMISVLTKGNTDQRFAAVYLLGQFLDRYCGGPFAPYSQNKLTFEKQLHKKGVMKILLDLLDIEAPKQTLEEVFNVLTDIVYDFPAKAIKTKVFNRIMKFIDFKGDRELRTHAICIFAAALHTVSEQQRLDIVSSTNILVKLVEAMRRYDTLSVHELNYVLRCISSIGTYDSGRILLKEYAVDLIENTFSCMKRFAPMGRRELDKDQSSIVRHGTGLIAQLAFDEDLCVVIIEKGLMLYFCSVAQSGSEQVLTNIFSLFGLLFFKTPSKAVEESEKLDVKRLIYPMVQFADQCTKSGGPQLKQNAHSFIVAFGKARGYIDTKVELDLSGSKVKSAPNYSTSYEDTSKSKVCAECKKPNATSRCSACKKVFYCSKECQKKHWSQHKKTCQKS
jgi:hypothetical protein